METQTVTREKRLAWLGKQIPNILTVVRIVLVPVFIILLIVASSGYEYLQSGNHYYYQLGALIVFCVAAFTDYLDGLLARRWNLVTNFGKLVDPIADKALMMSAFILLSYYSWLFWWFTILVILREFAVTFMRFILLRGGKVLPASKGGKLKTLLQCLLVFLMLLQPLIQHLNFIWIYIWIELLVLVVAFVATLVSAFVYFLDSWPDLRTASGDFFRGETSETAGISDSEDLNPEASELECKAERILAENPLPNASLSAISEPDLPPENSPAEVEEEKYVYLPAVSCEQGLGSEELREAESSDSDSVVEDQKQPVFGRPCWKPRGLVSKLHQEQGDASGSQAQIPAPGMRYPSRKNRKTVQRDTRLWIPSSKKTNNPIE